MAISKIQYNDKVAINIDSTIPDINKCNASDLNEIKSVVNNNADEIPSNDNLVNVGSSVDTDYKVNVLTTKNLYNIATNTNEKILGNDGSEIDSTGYCISDYIAVQPNTTYTISRVYENLPNSEDNMRLGLYTQNKTWIQRVFSSNKPYVYTTPSNCYFIRLSYQYTITNTNVQVEYGSTATTYEPFIQNTINVNNEKYTDTINVGTEINNKNRVNVLYSKNLFDGQLELGNYDGSGDKVSATNIYRNVNIIRVEPNTTYTFSINGVSQKYCLYYYNSSQTFISLDLSLTTGTFTTPANCYYINFRCFGSDFTSDYATLKVQLEKGSTATTYEPYIIPSIVVDNEEIYNKPVVLYDNPSGTTGDAILNDIPTNYKYIEIFYNDDQLFESSLKIKGSTHPFILSLAKGSGVENAIFLNSVRYTVVNNTLKYEKTVIMKLTTSGIALSGSSNVLKIYRVLGYK